MFTLAIAISAIVAAIFHKLISRLWLAAALSACVSTVVIWKIAESHFGWLDQIFFKNVAKTMAIALLVSLVVGKIIHRFAKRHGAER